MTNYSNNDCGRIKTPKSLKVHAKGYRVEKNKGLGFQKRNLFLAGTSKTKIVSSAGGISRDPRNRKKQKIAEEHPLAKAFTDSLSQTTSHISTKMAQDLSDKLQIALSRIAATTARSRIYLTSASDLKSKIFKSSPLISVEFSGDIIQFQNLIKEKGELLGGLWGEWEQCVRNIGILGRDEGVLKWKYQESLSSIEDQHKNLDEAKDDDEFNLLIEEIRMVGRVWAKKMEGSEKKIADEVLQQQQLAATVLL